MIVNKQTLFSLGIDNEKCMYIFDLKTLTVLKFSNFGTASEFCNLFNEEKCKKELLKHSRFEEKVSSIQIYLDTDQATGIHRVIYRSRGMQIICHYNSEELFERTRENSIINLEIGEDKNKNKIRVKWVIEQASEEFKEHIDRQYNEFQKGMRLLGKNVCFDYVIVGKYVILTRLHEYTNITIPSFVTSTSEFIDPREEITEITLLDGVKFIGSNMGYNSKNLKIKGGRTLEYIGNGSLNNKEVMILKGRKIHEYK